MPEPLDDTPAFDRIHLAPCLHKAVVSALENLRDDPAVTHGAYHVLVSGGKYRGGTLYAIAYGYLESETVACTCGAVPRH